MIRSVIFDFDGLIIDSEELWEKTDIELLGKKDIIYDNKIRGEIRGLAQKASIELYKRKFDLRGDTDSLVSERKAIFYNLAENKLHLLDGASKFIKTLSEKGLPLAIATGGHVEEKIREILNTFNLTEYFKALISSDKVANGKPSPDVYLFTAKKLQVKPSDCLVLEDAVNGVLAGKAAGMKVFGVNKDDKIRVELAKAGADKVFSSLSEIKEL